MTKKEKDEENKEEVRPEPVPEGDEGVEGEDEGVMAILKEARGWYLTALLVFLLLAVSLVIYLARFKSGEFLYAIF